MITRRKLLISAAATGALTLAGCDKLGANPAFRRTLEDVERWNLATQRSLAGKQSLAREFPDAARSRSFRANGNRDPATSAYARHRGEGFVNWRLLLDGLVETPLALSLADLAAMDQRRQTTRHDCVEGWSAIGTWQGVPLGTLLTRAVLQPQARFLVFHCADRFGDAPYYESIDLIDAFHPQTILATRLNDAALPVENGAPIRLRVERQLGYKHAKYVERIEVVANLSGIYGGKGGYWEDRGYAWYAGI